MNLLTNYSDIEYSFSVFSDFLPPLEVTKGFYRVAFFHHFLLLYRKNNKLRLCLR